MQANDPQRIHVYASVIRHGDLETVQLMESKGLVDYFTEPLKGGSMEPASARARFKVLRHALSSNSRPMIEHIWGQLKPERELVEPRHDTTVNAMINYCVQNGHEEGLRALLIAKCPVRQDGWFAIQDDRQHRLIPVLHEYMPCPPEEHSIVGVTALRAEPKVIKELCALDIDLSVNLPEYAGKFGPMQEKFDVLIHHAKHLRQDHLNQAMTKVCDKAERDTGGLLLPQLDALFRLGAEVSPVDQKKLAMAPRYGMRLRELREAKDAQPAMDSQLDLV